MQTRYTVSADNAAPHTFKSLDAALSFARDCVYLSADRVCDMQALLKAGIPAQWSYGFTVIIVPKAA